MFKHFLHVSLSEQASNMKDTAEVVKAALDESERAQSVAMDAIQLAQNNTKGTLDLLVTVSLTSDLQDYSTVWIQKWFSLLHLEKMYLAYEQKKNLFHTWEKNWKLWTQHTKNNNSVLHMFFLVSHMKKNTTDHKLIKYLLSFTHGRKKIEITQFQK